MNSALKRARRGAAFLDKKLGRGWRRKIRRRDLALQTPWYAGKGTCGCVLAQLDYAKTGEGEGHYWNARASLGLSWDEARALGFDVNNESYDELTDAWLTVLREG